MTPATAPTLYFIGVTTGSSSIMRVFPAWARHFGLGDARICGIDFPLHAAKESYRESVAFIRDDPLSMGALVTTHKIDLFDACRDMFDEIDPYAALMGETSCLSKRDGKLICHAKDPITSGLSLDGFLGDDYFARTGADVFSIGAGGSTIALSWYLMRQERGNDVPARIVVSDTDRCRLNEIRRIHENIDSPAVVEYVLVDQPDDNDTVLADLKPGALIVNATGMGKDTPGSPLTGNAVFPEQAVVWDLNYRGDLVFLEQAQAQASARQLTVHNGWTYFIHGWTQVIAEVFNVVVDTGADNIAQLTHIADAANSATQDRST